MGCPWAYPKGEFVFYISDCIWIPKKGEYNLGRYKEIRADCRFNLGVKILWIPQRMLIKKKKRRRKKKKGGERERDFVVVAIFFGGYFFFLSSFFFFLGREGEMGYLRGII